MQGEPKSLDRSKKESLRDIMDVVCRPHKKLKEGVQNGQKTVYYIRHGNTNIIWY